MADPKNTPAKGAKAVTEVSPEKLAEIIAENDALKIENEALKAEVETEKEAAAVINTANETLSKEIDALKKQIGEAPEPKHPEVTVKFETPKGEKVTAKAKIVLPRVAVGSEVIPSGVFAKLAAGKKLTEDEQAALPGDITPEQCKAQLIKMVQTQSGYLEVEDSREL